jgi:hypothetical protein
MKITAKRFASFMTNPTESLSSRRLACSACGTVFDCGLGHACWCMDESVRLPMPREGEDCLCRDCLRKAADHAAARQAMSKTA